MNPASINDLFQCPAIPVIMGATASGKSALAFELALRWNAEIISADSMQFYRGLDIGTAKPTPEERSRIPHHLIDTMDISEKSDIFRFCRDADAAIQDILARGRRPVIVGGSGLYLRALIYGLDPLPSNDSLHDELYARYDNPEHFPELCSLMARECPLDFERWHDHRRKLIRAREVFLLTGSPISTLQQVRTAPVPRPDIRSFFLIRARDVLKQRIVSRCDSMLRSGWIDETRSLVARGLLQTPTAWQALGYPLIAASLRGEFPASELPFRIATATWQFARRQLTWFRHQHPEAAALTLP